MRPAASLLKRVPAVWGTADRVEAKPDLTVLENAAYVPADGVAGHMVIPAQEHEYGDRIETAPDGFYILIDQMTGHYGHFVIDVLSRFWLALEVFEEPIYFVCEPKHGRALWEQHPFIGEILAGLDLGYETIVSFETPVILPRAAIPEPSFQELRCFHAVFGDLCRRAGRRYWSEAEVDSIERPAYLAKSHLTSGMLHLLNEEELVAELDRLGVDILFPEEMRFSEQVRQFASRRVVMGPLGSAFHTAAFSAPARRTIGLSSMMHLNSNYLMFDAINRTRAYYYFVPGTISGSKDGFGLAWRIPEPKAVAGQMMARAENFDQIDAHDTAVEREEARYRRSFAGRLGRLRDAIAARGQHRRSLADRQPR